MFKKVFQTDDTIFLLGIVAFLFIVSLFIFLQAEMNLLLKLPHEKTAAALKLSNKITFSLFFFETI